MDQGFLTELDIDKINFNKKFSFLNYFNYINNFSINSIYKTKFFFLNFEKIHPFFVLKLYQNKKNIDIFMNLCLEVNFIIKKKDF